MLLILYLSEGTIVSAYCPGIDYREDKKNNEAVA